MGYYLGLSKIAITNNRKDLRNKNLVLSVLVPTLTHGVYDYCLMTENVVFIILFYQMLLLLFITTRFNVIILLFEFMLLCFLIFLIIF